MALALTLVDTWPPALRDAATSVFAALQQQLPATLPTGTINLKLVDDAEIARLNERYSGNATTTDVLTFHYAETDGDSDGELADIVISLPTAERQAAAAGTELADEVGLLVAHGLLHALGYDHQTTATQVDIDRLQQAIVGAAELQIREFAWKH